MDPSADHAAVAHSAARATTALSAGLLAAAIPQVPSEVVRGASAALIAVACTVVAVRAVVVHIAGEAHMAEAHTVVEWEAVGKSEFKDTDFRIQHSLYVAH